MAKKTRINVYVSGKIEREIDYLAEKYEVSAAYVILSAYKICDRGLLEKLLSIGMEEE